MVATSLHLGFLAQSLQLFESRKPLEMANQRHGFAQQFTLIITHRFVEDGERRVLIAQAVFLHLTLSFTAVGIHRVAFYHSRRRVVKLKEGDVFLYGAAHHTVGLRVEFTNLIRHNFREVVERIIMTTVAQQTVENLIAQHGVFGVWHSVLF